jgi:D-proline reductase (dithiol) PrdB
MPTVGFTSARSITASANQPRAVFVDLPLGHTTGVPGDPSGQRQLLRDGLAAAHAMTEPGTIVDLPYRYVDDRWKADPLSWSRKRQNAGKAGTPAGDTRTTRSAEPRYQNDDDRAAAEAVGWDEQCQVCLGIVPG